MATTKHPGRKNNKSPKKQQRAYIEPAKFSESEEAREDREFREKYGKGGFLKNTLKIWRDSAPKGFITFFPIVLMHLLFSFLWFTSNILWFIPSTSGAGEILLRGLYNFNKYLAAFGMPLLLSLLHLFYNIKNKKYFFFNAFLYIVPAVAIYTVLDFINNVLILAFSSELKEIMRLSVEWSLLILAVSVVLVLVMGSICQAVLAFMKNRASPRPTKLGLTLPDKKDK